MSTQSTPLRVAVAGASGYTGSELLGLLARHPAPSRVEGLGSESAGSPLRAVLPPSVGPRLAGPRFAPTVGRIEDALKAPVPHDFVFLCLPHGGGVDVPALAARFLARGTRVVDVGDSLRADALSGAFPGATAGAPAASAAERPVYGLSEFFGERVATARLVANPGCYPTSVLLAVGPLARAGLLDPRSPLIVDAKSGASGAGRKPQKHLLLAEMEGGLTPYKLGREHRHVAEMEGALAALSPAGAHVPRVVFSPHLLPIARGLLSTIYVTLPEPLGADRIRAVIAGEHEGDAFIEVLPAGETATIAHVARTSRVAISVHAIEGDPSRVIVVGAIDNLLKGAASSAIRNFNLMRGAAPEEGLA